MKKLLPLLLVALLLAALPVSALDVGKLTVAAQPVDYVAALAGIARPVNKTYAANERYAVAVTVDVPAYMDVSGMTAVLEPRNCTIDSGVVPVAAGTYVLTGTVLAPGASIKIILRDDAITQAATAGQLWDAIRNDRTVSAAATLGPAAQAVADIPKTGDRPGIVGGALCLLLAAALWGCRRWAK